MTDKERAAAVHTEGLKADAYLAKRLSDTLAMFAEIARCRPADYPPYPVR